MAEDDVIDGAYAKMKMKMIAPTIPMIACAIDTPNDDRTIAVVLRPTAEDVFSTAMNLSFWTPLEKRGVSWRIWKLNLVPSGERTRST